MSAVAATTTTGEPLLRVEGLAKAFGGIRAVQGVDLAVARGELRCLIGPNGAGKSTLFALLAGLEQPDAGRILFEGEDVTRMSPFRRVRRGICLKFQTTRIYRGLTMGENLTLARGRRRGASSNGRLEWALGALGLARESGRPAGELSHSHQQWLEICLALATEPRLLLLDEPTAGMTPEETALTADFVVRLADGGITVLVVEHDMAFVRHVARGVTVLHYGKVFADGTFEQIEANHEVRRIYLGEE